MHRPALPALLVLLPLLSNAAELGEIVVSAHRPLVEQAGTVRELDAESLEDRHAETLDDALRWLPGVNVRTGGNGTPRIDVRGFRTRHVKLLLNGVPLNSAADGNFDPSLIPTDWISRVKLSTGATSQLYGDGALGGVINVLTRRGGDGGSGMLRMEGANDGSTRFGGTYGWGNERADVFVSLARRDSAGFDLPGDFAATPFEDGGRRMNSQSTRNSGLLNGAWRPRDDLELGLTAQLTEGDHGLPPGIFEADGDPFAQRPKFDRVRNERSWFAQASARFEPGESWRHLSWAYASEGRTALSRYEDGRFLRTTDPSVRNTFDDTTLTRTVGAHHQTEYTHPLLGTLALMLEGRQEKLVGECHIQDVPLVVPAPPPPPPVVPPTSLVVDYTLTTTNGAGITGPGGGNDPIARLVASNRAGGGIDFTLTNLASDRFGTDSFLQSVFLKPVGGFDPTGLGYTLTPGSAGEIGNVRFFQALEDADGYDFPIQVNFKRPGQGNPLLAGETASWIFSTGKVTDFFGQAVPSKTGELAPIYSAIRLRGTDLQGFWGDAPVDQTGGGAFHRVFVGAPAVVDPLAPPPPPLPEEGGLAGQLIQDRVCGGGAGGGDGSGGGDGGDGSGGNRVQRLPGYVFGKRVLAQDRAVGVMTTAAEWSVAPWKDVGLVAGVGTHWLHDDEGETSAEPSYNLAATWRPLPGLRLKTSHARKVRPPSIAQLYDPVSGNRSLAFERAEITEAGVRKALGLSSSVEVTFFHQDVAGLIQRDPVSGLFENVAQSRFDGLEFAGQTTLLPRLRLDAAYTYLASRDESPNTARKAQQYTPGNTLALAADYAATERLALHAGLRRVADQVFYSRSTPLQRGELADYTLVDASVRYTLPGERITLYSGVENLFDEDYAEAYGLPQRGRFLYAGLQFTLP